MYDTSKRVSMPLLDGPPWGPEGGEDIGKSSYFNLPPDIGFKLFTPIKGLGPVEQVRSKNHCQVGQNCRLYNHYGSIFILYRFPG
jgi:hypothetical protein